MIIYKFFDLKFILKFYSCFFLDGFASGLMGLFATQDTNRHNAENIAATNQTNKDIANQNLGFQRENLDYTKALNQQLMEREDSAYARTSQDMYNAGLSPLSMQSTNSAGSPLATEALHNDYSPQTYQKQNPAQYLSQMFTGVGSVLSDLEDLKSKKLDNESKEIENKFSNLTFASRIAQFLNNESLQNENLWNMANNNEFKRFLGISDHTPPQVVMAKYLMSAFGYTSNKEYISSSSSLYHKPNSEFKFGDLEDMYDPSQTSRKYGIYSDFRFSAKDFISALEKSISETSNALKNFKFNPFNLFGGLKTDKDDFNILDYALR